MVSIVHPEGRKLPDDHPLRPGAPMMILSVRRRPRSTTSTEKPSEDSSESPKPEQSSEPKPDQT